MYHADGVTSYQGTVHGPGVGLRAGRAACVALLCSATSVGSVCCRTVVEHNLEPHG